MRGITSNRRIVWDAGSRDGIKIFSLNVYQNNGIVWVLDGMQI